MKEYFNYLAMNKFVESLEEKNKIPIVEKFLTETCNKLEKMFQMKFEWIFEENGFYIRGKHTYSDYNFQIHIEDMIISEIMSESINIDKLKRVVGSALEYNFLKDKLWRDEKMII